MNEKWREVYTQEQISKIQKLELKNLRVLDEVCKKIGVEYFVYGGTLIGAVRHKGFVPWDDDLDVAMSRQDYMKFIAQAPAHLPEEYYLQSPYTDKKTPYLYTKLRLKGTRCVEYIHHRLDIEQGIYIDIYPIDCIPDDDDEYMDLYRRFQKLARLFVLRQCCFPSVEERTLKRRLKNIARFCASCAMKLIPHRLFIEKMDALMTKHNGTKTVRMGNLSYISYNNLFFDPFPMEKGVFEGMEVNLPGGWHHHLTARYGDYMELPPEEERLGHKPYVLDFGEYE